MHIAERLSRTARTAVLADLGIYFVGLREMSRPDADVPRVLGVEANGLRYQEIMPLPGPFPAHPAGGYFVPWASIVPFMVGADGTVSVVTRLRLPDGREIDLPALRPLVESGRLPPKTEPLTVWGSR